MEAMPCAQYISDLEATHLSAVNFARFVPRPYWTLTRTLHPLRGADMLICRGARLVSSVWSGWNRARNHAVA